MMLELSQTPISYQTWPPLVNRRTLFLHARGRGFEFRLLGETQCRRGELASKC